MRRTSLIIPLLLALAACTAPDTSKKVALTEKDHTFGTATSTVTLVTYGDYQCPACAYYETMVAQLQERYRDRVVFAFRHFPLEQIHKNALAAAEAAECAAAQGKFWEMHSKLYATQNEWSKLADPTENFVGYATTLGLDAAKFRTELTGHTYREVVKASGAQAASIGINATPTFFLNGEKLTNQPQNYTSFQALIDKALAEVSQASPAPSPSSTGTSTAPPVLAPPSPSSPSVPSSVTAPPSV